MDVGKQFSSWESFINALEQYSKEHEVSYVIGTCKPVETANKNDSLQNKFPVKFRYCFARMLCNYFGNDTNSSTCLRPHQRACTTGCTSSILVSVDKKRTALVIKEADVQHTHDVSENIISRYTQSLRLQGEERCMASVLLRSGVPVCRVQEFISTTFSKESTIKDLQNVKASIKRSFSEKEGHEYAFLSDLDQLMAEDPECVVEINNFSLTPGAIYIQTSEMTERMNSMHDGLLQIVTQYVNEGKISVVSITGIDGDLTPNILAFCITIVDGESTFRYFIEAFVRINPVFCDSLRGVVLDCSKENAEFLQLLIPHASVAWSRSYILEQFVEKMKNSTKNIQKNMQLCKELMNASTNEIYEKKLNEFLHLVTSIDSKELLRTWNSCKELWAQYEISSQPGLQHQKSALEKDYINFLKSFFKSSMSLSELIRALLKLNKNEESEETVKESVVFNIDPSCEQYHHLCFPAAAQAVICQLSIALSSLYEIKEQTDMIFVKKMDIDDEVILDTSGSTCTCRYFLDTNLPCQHIFAWLKFSNKPLYNELLIPTKLQIFGKSVTLNSLARSLAQGQVPSSRQHDERLKELQTVLKDTLSSCCSHSYDQMGKDLVLLKQICTIIANNLAHNTKLEVIEEEKGQYEALPNNTPSIAPTPRKRGRPRKNDKIQEEVLQQKVTLQQQKIHLSSSPQVQTPALSMRHNLRTNIKHKFVTRALHTTSNEKSNASSIHGETDAEQSDSVILSKNSTEDLGINTLKTDSFNTSLDQSASGGPSVQACMNGNILSRSLVEEKDKRAFEEVSDQDSLSSVITPRHQENDELQCKKVRISTSQRAGRPLSVSYTGIKRPYPDSQNDSTASNEENEGVDEEEQKDETEDDGTEDESSDSDTETLKAKKARTLKNIETFLSGLSENVITEVMHTTSMLESLEERSQNAKDESEIISESAPDVLIRVCQNKIEDVNFIIEHIQISSPGYDKYAYQVAASIICQAFHSHVPIISALQSVSAWPSHLPDLPTSRSLETEITLAAGQTLTVCGHKLNQFDMDTLKSDKDISSKVLHAYLELLSQKHNGKMFVIPFDVILEWRDGRFSQNIFRKVHFKTFEFLVLPIHCGAEFTDMERKCGDIVTPCWMALVADVKKRTVGVMNPRSEDKYIIAANGYMLQWRRYMQIRSVHTGEMLSSWTTRRIECSNLGIDQKSGMFLLMNVEALISDVPPIVMTEAHISNYLLYVAVALRDMDRETTVMCIGGPECQQQAARDADWLQCENCRTWWHQACVRYFGSKQPFYCSPCQQRIAAVGDKMLLMDCDDEEEEEQEDILEEDVQKETDMLAMQADGDYKVVQKV